MWLLPPHYAREVAIFLNKKYPGRWISRNGLIRWPVRSPDLNPCDFYLWGHMKQIVYIETVTSVEELTLRIQLASAQIRADSTVFSTVDHAMIHKAETCIANWTTPTFVINVSTTFDFYTYFAKHIPH